MKTKGKVISEQRKRRIINGNYLYKLLCGFFSKTPESVKTQTNKYPNEIKNIWYNRTVWSEKEKYPIVFDKHGDYIKCRIGTKIIMFETFTKKFIYEITDIRRSAGGDFYYDSDAYHCDLKFSHVEIMNI